MFWEDKNSYRFEATYSGMWAYSFVVVIVFVVFHNDN